MADDRLRMIAEVVDDFSGNLRKLKQMLGDVHSDQDKHARAQKENDKQLSEGMRTITRNLNEGMRPALALIGLELGSVAGTIGSIIAKSTGFAETVRALDQVARQTKTSTTHLRELAAVAELVGINFDTAVGGFKNLTDNMSYLRAGVGSTYDFMKQRPILQPLLADMQHAKTDFEAFEKLVDGVRKLPLQEAQKREILRAFGLPEEWASLEGSIKDAMEKAGAHIAGFSRESVDNAKRFTSAWRDTKLIFEQLGNAIGASVLPKINELLGSLNKIIESWDKLGSKDPKNLRWFHGTTPDAPKAGDWKWGSFGKMLPGGKMDTAPSPEAPSPEPAPPRGVWHPGVAPSHVHHGPGGGPPAADDESKKLIERGTQEGTKEGARQGVIEGLRQSMTFTGGALGDDGRVIQAAYHPGGGGGGLGGGALGRFGGGGGVGSGGGGMLPPSIGTGARGGPSIGTGGGRANFFKGEPAGPGDLTTIEAAGKKITVRKEAATDIKGFLDDIKEAGAPVDEVGGYNRRRIAGSNRWSQHAYGGAIDVDQSSRNVVSPKFKAWADSHREKLSDIAKAHHMISGGDWDNPDFGHFEWSPTDKATASGGSTVKGSTFDDRTTASGHSAATTAGIALPSGGKMGDMYKITTPDGRSFTAPLIDRGPAKWTGRGVDISGPLAKQMGYGRDFPTDSKFGVEPIKRGALLDAAQKSPVTGGGETKITGGADLKIDVRGMPKGTRSWLETHGAIFDKTDVNMGNTSAKAGQ